MTITAALLDAPASSGKGIYLRIEELANAADLTDRHVPTVTECDLPSGRYRWIPTDNAGNPYGGAFWDVEVIAKLGAELVASLEHA